VGQVKLNLMEGMTKVCGYLDEAAEILSSTWRIGGGRVGGAWELGVGFGVGRVRVGGVRCAGFRWRCRSHGLSSGFQGST
jgi:hypothetical protein